MRTNLTGAKYTLATNKAGAELGITDFASIAAHEKELDGKIYGIEPGNDGNRLMIDMIAQDEVRDGHLRGRRILGTGHAGSGHPRRQPRPKSRSSSWAGNPIR
jgi:hypothetical protein